MGGGGVTKSEIWVDVIYAWPQHGGLEPKLIDRQSIGGLRKSAYRGLLVIVTQTCFYMLWRVQ